MTLGEQIKQRREVLNMTQEDLAERLGVSRQAVSKWEGGQSLPHGDNRAALCALLELDGQEPQEGKAPRRGLLLAGWITAAVLFLALAGLVLFLFFQPTTPEIPQALPSLLSVRFYDQDQEEVQSEALWYNTAAVDSILVEWTGGTPYTIRLFFTPGGTETMELTELLMTRSVLDGHGCALLPADCLHRDSLFGHFSVQLMFPGDVAVTSDLYNVFCDPDLL